MLNMINLPRNINQNHNEYHYTLTRMSEMKETENATCWRECGGTILSYVAGESVKEYNHFEKQFSYKVKHMLNM